MMTATDVEVIKESQADVNIFTRYYFNGLEMLPWQKLMHHALQKNTTIIGGVGSGKTVGIGLSAATWCGSVPYFKFMDVAPTSWQASLMYDSILTFAEAGRYQDTFIVNHVSRPYPKITLGNGSTLEFMTAQKDITRIRGWEGDWMNGDEFGFIITFATTCAIMRTRLRGITPYKRHRIGRLSISTTATDNPELWERFDRYQVEPKRYLSFVVRTEDNTNLAPEDIREMRAELPEALAAVEMDGDRPMGTGEIFPLSLIGACESPDIIDLAEAAMKNKVAGAIHDHDMRLGTYRFSLPPVPGHEYLIVGDPGTGIPPKRNAGVVMVLDITDFPEHPASMAACAWIAGNGKYAPFVEQYKAWYTAYHCTLTAALEATGIQKTFAEYVLILGLSGETMYIEEIDLTGNRKNNAIQAAIQLFFRKLWVIPFMKGLRRQLTNYKLPDKNIPQDLVSCLTCAALWLKNWRIWGEPERQESEEDELDEWFEETSEIIDRAMRTEPLMERGR